MDDYLKDSAHWILSGNNPKVLTYSLCVVYFGRLIALVSSQGKIVWRDKQYPLFLIEYLIENPTPSPQKVRLS